jgi:hypothetical protein
MKSDAWLTYIDEFMNEYYRELPNFKSYKDCYEAIEERHKAIFDRPRFSSYTVFRSMLSRWLKTNR